MSDTLSYILAYKRDEVAVRKSARPQAAIEEAARNAPPVRPFADTLAAEARTGLALIAEIKKASPSRGVIRADFDVPSLAKAYSDGGAACLSVLTDEPSFQGHDSYLLAARNACPLPVLRKDFMVDPWQAAESRALGADAILIIMAAVSDALARELAEAAAAWKLDTLVECHDEIEVERALSLPCKLIGVNNRDLRTFKTDIAVTERLAPLVPHGRLLVSESGLFTHADLTRLSGAGAGAFLIGEALMRQADVMAATRAVLGRSRE